MNGYFIEDDNMVYSIFYAPHNGDSLPDKRRIVSQWGPEAEALLDQLLELRKTANAAKPMPLDVAIECNAKHAILCGKVASLAEPHVKALEASNKGIVKGFRSNLVKGVVGDPNLVLTCLDHMTKYLSGILEEASGLSEIRSCFAWFRDWKEYNCKGLINRKAELEAQRNKHAAKWGE